MLSSTGKGAAAIWLPPLFQGIALTIALCVQMVSSPLAGAWLWPYLLSCGMLCINNRYERLPWPELLWLLTVGTSCFIINPVPGGAYYMWVILASPVLAMSLTKDDLMRFTVVLGAVLIGYAVWLSWQRWWDLRLNPLEPDSRMSWPLLDPNNAACMMQFLFTPFLFLTLFKDLRWFPLALLSTYALYATGSKTGIAAAALTATILFTVRHGWPTLAFIVSQACLWLLVVFLYRPDLIADGYNMLAARFPIWWVGYQLLHVAPFKGIGLGNFANASVRQGDRLYLPPTFAHNDTLQFAVEMGIPAALVFCTLCWQMGKRLCRENMAISLTLLAVLIQSCMEFQFYLPSITICFGLTMAWQRLTQASRPRRYGSVPA